MATRLALSQRDLRVAGAVLAGGQSRRMGQDKRFLVLSGERLIDRAQRVLEQGLVGIGSSVTVNLPVLLSGQISGVACVMDLVPGRGPLGGIHAVLCELLKMGEGTWVIFLPVDMPGVSSQMVTDLMLAALRADGDAWMTVAVHYKGSCLPLCLRATQAVVNEVELGLAHPSSQQWAVKSLLMRLGALWRVREVEAMHELSNINTPQEWQGFREGMSHETSHR